jgi:SAM-dependent methyltransferase
MSTGAETGSGGDGVTTIWHDLECGAYEEDVPLWRDLARHYGSPVLDVGAGTGRITLDLAGAGHAVTAIDLDAELIAALRRRAAGLPVTALVADARALSIATRFALCIVPMQTIQLLGGPSGRIAFLTAARAHLAPGGAIAIALAERLDLFDVSDGAFGPLPDVCEIDGTVYSSSPIAVRQDGDGYVLERRREIVGSAGELAVTRDLIRLDRLTAQTLEREARECELRPATRLDIPPTDDYAGSTVVVLGG